MARWITLLGGFVVLSGCNLADLFSNDRDETTDDDTDEAPTGEGNGEGNGGGLLGGGNGGGLLGGGAGGGDRESECELGAEAICVCLDGGYYACSPQDLDDLIAGCVAGGPDAEFVLCVADLVTEDLTIDCYLAADVCVEEPQTP